VVFVVVSVVVCPGLLSVGRAGKHAERDDSSCDFHRGHVLPSEILCDRVLPS